MNALRRCREIYQRSYEKRPMLTLCITNGILGIASDALAQAITRHDAYQQQHGQHGIHLDEHLPARLSVDHSPQEPGSYDVQRTLRFATYNTCVAPLVGTWYMFLDRFFPMPAAVTEKAASLETMSTALRRQANRVAIKRMLADQTVFAPLGLVVFFSVMGLIESRSWDGVREKFQDAYGPALMANYKLWPIVQFVNFKWMPLPYRLPFVSSVGIVWNAYLSWLNNASRQVQHIHESLREQQEWEAKESVYEQEEE